MQKLDKWDMVARTMRPEAFDYETGSNEAQAEAYRLADELLEDFWEEDIHLVDGTELGHEVDRYTWREITR